MGQIASGSPSPSSPTADTGHSGAWCRVSDIVTPKLP